MSADDDIKFYGGIVEGIHAARGDGSGEMAVLTLLSPQGFAAFCRVIRAQSNGQFAPEWQAQARKVLVFCETTVIEVRPGEIDTWNGNPLQGITASMRGHHAAEVMSRLGA